jgi:hypothetical protein
MLVARSYKARKLQNALFGFQQGHGAPCPAIELGAVEPFVAV